MNNIPNYNFRILHVFFIYILHLVLLFSPESRLFTVKLGNQSCARIDNWVGALIHIFVFTDLKNNPFQKKVIGQNTNIWIISPPPHLPMMDLRMARKGIYLRPLKEPFGFGVWHDHMIPLGCCSVLLNYFVSLLH